MGISSVIFALLCFELNGMELCKEMKNLITIESLPALFKLSKRHDLAHLVGNALARNGLLPEGSEIEKCFLQECDMAVYRYVPIQYEFEQICDVFEEAKIAFIPLKGAVIRRYYPEPWMRTSCDIDILVHEENLQQAIEVLRKTLDYRYENMGSHDAHLFAESGVHLELHYKLNAKNEPWNAILETIWDYRVDDSAYHGVLTKEMFYFYHIAHMAGHFKVGGCGVRSFLDLYLLRKHNQYDEQMLNTLLKNGGLSAFNEAVISVAENWFGDGERTELIESMENYILYAGMYGDMRNRVAVVRASEKSRTKILFARIFVPYEQLKYQYPFLQKCPILYPFYVVKRWFRLLKKDRRKKSLRELKETARGDEKRQERVARLLKALEL